MSLLKIVGIALLGTGLASCTTASGTSDVAEISAPAGSVKLINVVSAARLLSEDQGIVLLDVRTPQEFETGHIRGAQNVDFLNTDFLEKIGQLDKSKNYVVYCGSGRRSGKATAQMSALGFSNITDVDGGMAAWNEASLPVEK